MLLDCFIFADEIEIAEIRFGELYDSVDQFCIVESCFDQCRNPKPFNFELNIDRYKPFLDKITYYKITDFIPPSNQFCWLNEIYVRNSLAKSINKYYEINQIRPNANDKILFSDCDEIVNNKALKEALELNRNLLSFTHLFNCYKLNLYAPARKWYGAILVDYLTLMRHESFEVLRREKDSMFHYENPNYPSWHFSGVGVDSFKTNLHKFKTRIEPRDKTLINHPDFEKFFNKCVFDDKYFFYSDNPFRRDEDLKLENLSVDLLPQYIKDNLHKYQDLLYYYENPEKS